MEGSYVEVDADADISRYKWLSFDGRKGEKKRCRAGIAEKERLKGKVKKVDPPPLLSFLISLEALQRRHSS